jgi:hypothetical protein
LVWICLATIFPLSSLLGWDAWFKKSKNIQKFWDPSWILPLWCYIWKKKHIQLCNS